MKITKLKIEKILIQSNYKDGRPILSFGKPAKKVAIKVDGKWYGSYPSSKQDDPIFNIKENDTIEAIVWQSGEFNNFKLPTRLDRLEIRVSELENAIFKGQSENTNYPEQGGHIEDIKHTEDIDDELPF